jgi:hypothetical protein
MTAREVVRRKMLRGVEGREGRHGRREGREAGAGW